MKVSVLPLLHAMQLDQKCQGKEGTILKQGVPNVVFQPFTKGCFSGNFSGLMLANY